MRPMHILKILGTWGIMVSSTAFLTGEDLAGVERTQEQKIGVYDSRVIAYAHFWQEPRQSELRACYEAAKSAEKAGDTNRLEELKALMRAGQERIHLQVFSTAPIDNVLEEMTEKLTTVKAEAGVVRLVSKWDSEALKIFPRNHQVEVTDLLLSGFTLNEQQQKVIKSMRSQTPLPLEEAKRMLREGKL